MQLELLHKNNLKKYIPTINKNSVEFKPYAVVLYTFQIPAKEGGFGRWSVWISKVKKNIQNDSEHVPNLQSAQLWKMGH